MENPYRPIETEVLEAVQETPTIRTIKLKPKEPIHFVAGQFIELTIPGVGEAPFTPSSRPTDKEVIQLEQNLLKNMLSLTSFAVSHEESRYVLNGVLMEISGDKICMVATDGRRLAKIEKKIASPVKKDITAIIPTKAVAEICRNLKEEGDVSIIVGMNQVLFDIEGTLIATRIIEGDFPNYNQVIPKEGKYKITVSTEKLLSAIRRANLLSTPIATEGFC